MSFHDLRDLDLWRLQSAVLFCMIFGSISGQQTWPNHDGLRRQARISTCSFHRVLAHLLLSFSSIFFIFLVLFTVKLVVVKSLWGHTCFSFRMCSCALKSRSESIDTWSWNWWVKSVSGHKCVNGPFARSVPKWPVPSYFGSGLWFVEFSHGSRHQNGDRMI